MSTITRTARAIAALSLLGSISLAGCAAGEPENTPPVETPTESVEPSAIKIGTLATQDSLPLWVAEQEGYFAEAGLPEVEIIAFQSAQDCQVAFVSGAVDALMTDIIVAANLQASGTPVEIATVMLGATTEEGRFAIVAAPGSGITAMEDLKGIPVGTASATITEYILDKLMEQAGVAEAEVVKEEVKKMPVRFELLMAGQLKAAALPEPFVSLAEQGGATVVDGGDDTLADENISQSILCVNAEYTSTPAGAAALEAVLEAWDRAVADITASPDDFRQTLVDKAQLPAVLATTYKVSTYPKAAAPTAAQIEDVLDWMGTRGYLSAELAPEDLLAE